MNINISYPEIQSLLQSKMKQELFLSYVDGQAIKVGKTITVSGFPPPSILSVCLRKTKNDRVVGKLIVE